MKIKLLCMGDVRDAIIDKAISQYSKKIPFYWPFSYVCLSDVKSAKTAGQDKQKELEGKRFMSEISPGDFVMLLDERGKQFTSREFSEFIARKSVELPLSRFCNRRALRLLARNIQSSRCLDFLIEDDFSA